MKKVLIIDEHFPNTGGNRTEKFVKYLPEFGWKPIILTKLRENKGSFLIDVLREFKNVNYQLYQTMH